MEKDVERKIQLAEKAILTDERHWSLSVSETTVVLFSIIWLLMLLPAALQLGSNPLLLTNLFSGAALLLMSNHVLKNKRKLAIGAKKLELHRGYLPWDKKIELESKDIKSVYLTGKKNTSKATKGLSNEKPELWITMRDGEKIKLLESAPFEQREYFEKLKDKMITFLDLQKEGKRKKRSTRRKQKRLKGHQRKARKARSILQYGNKLLDARIDETVEFQFNFWQIDFRYQYDWPNEETDHFLLLKDEQNSTFVFIRSSTGSQEIFQEKILKSGILNRKKKINRSSLPSNLKLGDQHYYKEFSGKGLIFRNNNPKVRTAVQILYLNKIGTHSLRIFKEPGKDTNVYLGVLNDSSKGTQ